jgi:hypothetical protein
METEEFENEEQQLEEFLETCEQRYYAPSDSMEFYNVEQDQWYNRSGQELIAPESYNYCSADYER